MAFVSGGGYTPSPLAPSARPGPDHLRARQVGGEPPSRYTRAQRGLPTTSRYQDWAIDRDEREALYGDQYLVTDDRPAVYYGPGGTLVYPSNYRSPIYMGLGDAEGKDTGYIVSQYGVNGQPGTGMIYKDGMEANLPRTKGWGDKEVNEFRAFAIHARPFYPGIYDANLGQLGIQDWGTEGDLQAMRWYMGLANSQNTDVMSVASILYKEIDDGNITPYDVLADLQGLDTGASGSQQEYELLTKKVDKRIELTAFDTARTTLANLMRDLLGRDASTKEVQQFLSTLNTLERANPTITTTEFEYDEERYGAQPTATTTVSEPGEIDTASTAFDAAYTGNEQEARDFGLGRVRQMLNDMVGL